MPNISHIWLQQTEHNLSVSKSIFVFSFKTSTVTEHQFQSMQINSFTKKSIILKPK